MGQGVKEVMEGGKGRKREGKGGKGREGKEERGKDSKEARCTACVVQSQGEVWGRCYWLCQC